MQTQIKQNKEIKNQIFILNQIFEIENKLSKLEVKHTINRNIDKLKSFYEDGFNDNISYIIENPIGQEYSETRTDVEANIVGDSVKNLIIIDVIKPIVRIKQGETNQIIQKGIVIVQDKNTIIKNEGNNVIYKNLKTKNEKKYKKRRRK